MAKKAVSGKKVPVRFAGKTFALTGNVGPWYTERCTRMIEVEGGRLVEGVSEQLDYLVAFRGGTARADRKTAEKLNKAQKARIQILTEQDFYNLLLPDRDLSLALLAAGPRGIERWSLVRREQQGPVDLSGADLRQARLKGVNLGNVNLDRADLSGADLSGSRLGRVAQARFDGANLRGLSYGAEFVDCSLVGADLTGADFHYQGSLERSDFTAATLVNANPAHFAVCAAGSVFAGANLEGIHLSRADLQGADFTRANLTGAALEESKLPGATLRQARLHKADLTRADLSGADLTDADLTGAILLDADLTGATIDGADFAGANVLGARVGGLDLGKARGFAPMQPPGRRGPHVRQLAKVGREAQFMETKACLALPDGDEVLLEIESYYKSGGCSALGKKADCIYLSRAATFEAGLLDLPRRWPDGKLRLESITVKDFKAPLKGKALLRLAIAAWCEALGEPVPTTEKFEELEQGARDDKQRQRETMLKELRGGERGVKRWNQRGTDGQRATGPFRKVDLSGARLDGISLYYCDFSGSSFASASLHKGYLYGGTFKQANFRQADCREADLEEGKFQGADFEEAKLTRCQMGRGKFQQANFKGADLGEASLTRADLCGADLSTARLTGTDLHDAAFDADTRFPPGFQPVREMRWAGTGPDPRGSGEPVILERVEIFDLDTLLGRLRQHTEPGRVANALQMLKADRFRLFSQVDANALVGVVKSQSDPDLVYSCRLAADGSFSCCTQNLRPCGGLRGKPCKHLLVLIVGLAKGGQLEPAAVDQWVQASRTKKPTLDRDAASAVFLRYKGAEAGEIDWRPTETIPEDFYAF